MRKPSPSSSQLVRLALAACALGVACDTLEPGNGPMTSSATGGSTFTTTGVGPGQPSDAGRADGSPDEAGVFLGPDAQTFPDVPEWTGDDFDPTPAPETFRFVRRVPADDATDVAPDVHIELTFSHDIQPTSFSRVTITRIHDDSTVAATETVEGPVLRITPSVPLEPGEGYSVRVGRVSPVEDHVQGDLSHSNWDNMWSFTVAEADSTIPLEGPLGAFAYDADRARLWAVDPEARTLVLVDLEAGEEVARDPLVYVPSDLCVSPDGATIYIANRGTSLLTEVDAQTREVRRQIPWPGVDDGSEAAHLHVRCGQDRLWLVDAATDPALWSVDTTAETPSAVDHGALVSGVGELVHSPAEGLLYVASQSGWGPQTNLSVHAIDSTTFVSQDVVDIGPSVETEVALDAPIFVDPAGSRVVTRNRVLQSDDLSIVLFTFGADVILRAADFERGRVASLSQVYSLQDYRVQAPVLTAYARRVFFDSEGALNVIVDEPTPRILRQTFAEPDM